MRNSFLDFVAPGGKMKAGDVVFKLNTLELDRETFKLAVELQNARLTEKRLSQAFLDRLVMKPLLAGVDFASADLQAARNELRIAIERFEVGELTRVDVVIASAQVSERESLLARAHSDLTQRTIEIDGQQRRLKAQLQDLNERIALNARIRELHMYHLPADGEVKIFGFEGAFVEEGDLICEVSK